MSIFKGLGQLYTPVVNVSSDQPNSSIVGLYLVLDVMLSSADQKANFTYRGPHDIGKIRIKPVHQTESRSDEEITTIAYPADKRSVSYPLPGELVFVFTGTSNQVNDQGKPDTTKYYQTTTTQNGSVTYNSLPNTGNKQTRTNDPISTRSGTNPVTSFINNVIQKFNSKLKNKDSFIAGNVNENNVLKVTVKERPALQPFEGDVIHQGRFGQSIRFGSTNTKSNNLWSGEGLSGAPIIVQRVQDGFKVSEVSNTVEDINNDNSSLYLCSTQKIEMRLSCSKNMNSWRTVYKLKKDIAPGAAAANVATSKDDTQSYQKIIDTTQPLSQAYQIPL